MQLWLLWSFCFPCTRIGKGSGYRPSELESMMEGHTLCVGGKEIEVGFTEFSVYHDV